MAKRGEYIAIYSRKSKFTGKGESIDNQVELCKEYIRNHYGESALENIIVFEDEGFSGGNLNRPDFKKMMEAAKAHKLKMIIVYRLDRISRNISDFSSLIEDLSRLDIAFVSIKEQFDTSSPMGRAMMYISSVFSQLERETIAERIRDNMHELAKTGRWLGGTTPTGFSSESVQTVTVDGKKKKACKLKLNEDEAANVGLIFELFRENNSLTTTETLLIKQGIRTRNGNYYTRFSIKAILQNPVYMIADQEAYQYLIENEVNLFSDEAEFDGVHGIIAYNRTDQQKGKATIFKPMNEWIVSVGEHPGFVSGKDWVDIQKKLEQNKSKSYRTARKNEALLTGLLYCTCGSQMYPKLSTRKDADGNIIFSYMCKMKERSRRTVCSNKNVNGNILDMAVLEQIKQLSEDKSSFVEQLEKSRKFYTGDRTNYERQLADARKEKEEAEKKIERLIDSLADMDSHTAKEAVSKRIEQLDKECKEIGRQIQELEGLTSQNELSAIEFDVLRQMLSVFSSTVDIMTVDEKRTAIRTLVRKVIWDGTNAHVILFGASDEDIEYPDLSERYACQSNDEETDDRDFIIDIENAELGEDCLGKTNPLNDDSMFRWGEDRK